MKLLSVLALRSIYLLQDILSVHAMRIMRLTNHISLASIKQEAQLMLTTGSTRLAVSRGQQTWYHSTCYI